MAQIKPFNGLRFSKTAGDIRSLTCPPYDIISASERTSLLENNPYNIVRLELPAGKDCYKQAGETLNEWLNQGILEQDKEPCYYIYEQEFKNGGISYTLKGLVARIKLEEFEKGVVLPHEDTLSKAKEDRFQLMKATGCNFSQVYSLYHDPSHKVEPILDQISLANPDVAFEDSAQVYHRMWKVLKSDKTDALEQLLHDKKLYIADGHHRYETALRYRNYLREQGINNSDDHPSNYIMMMIADIESSGLVVLPTHRIVHSLKDFDLDAVLEQASKYFTIQQFDQKATAEHHMTQAKECSFILYKNEKFIVLTLNDDKIMSELFPNSSEDYRHLDVAVIHALFLELLLGIDKQKLANQENISYTRSRSEAIGQVNCGKADFSLLLAPTKVSEIKSIALAGEKMPQKSTYFYPKLITGLVMNKML